MTTTILSLLQKELEVEAGLTRNMLSIVPDDKFDWKPHVKSMSMKQLVTHIAELPGWISMALHTHELDFANNPYVLPDINNIRGVLDFFEQTLAQAKTDLANANEVQLWENWKLRNGEQILSDGDKYGIIRITLCQIVHHRAQLGVYLRLLDVKIPGTYGPSADDMGF